MPHIHTEPGQHDHTASAYIVRTDGAEPRILFHLHKKLHKYIQIGGHIELNETPWQAITHEIAEESGYAMSQLSILQPPVRITELPGADLHPQPVYHNTHHFNTTHFHTDIAYAFVTTQDPTNTIGDGESSNLVWLTKDELAALPPAQTFESVRIPALFVLGTCLTEWDQLSPNQFDYRV